MVAVTGNNVMRGAQKRNELNKAAQESVQEDF
jgi:hypothetical protein